MRCADLERLLSRYVAGELDAADAARLRDHLSGCVECRELVVAATRPEPDDAAVAGEAIVAGVMARTSGPACEAAEGKLAAFVTGELGAMDAELVAAHLGGCTTCRELAEVLTWTPATCREIACVEPPADFTAAVVERTRRARSPRVWRRRLRRAWLRAVLRPRFPLELGYAGALVAALLVGPPGAPFRPALDRVAELARTNPVEVVSAGVRGTGWIDGATAVGGWVYGHASRRTRATRVVVRDVRAHGGELFDAIAAGDVGGVSVRLEEVGGDLERLLNAIVNGVTGASTHGEIGADEERAR